MSFRERRILDNFTLRDLLDVIEERFNNWNLCAVGERFNGFENSNNDEKPYPKAQIMQSGFTSEEADQLILEGRSLMELANELNRRYLEVQHRRASVEVNAD